MKVRQEDLVLLKDGIDFKSSTIKGRDIIGRPELSSQQLSAIAKKKGYHGWCWTGGYNQKTGEQMVRFYKTRSAGGVKGSKAKYNRFWNKLFGQIKKSARVTSRSISENKVRHWLISIVVYAILHRLSSENQKLTRYILRIRKTEQIMLRDVRLVTHCCANNKQSKRIELHYLVIILR